jgi:hypothetical protein
MSASAISVAFHSTAKSRRSRGAELRYSLFLARSVVVLSTMSWELALAQIPDLATG